MTIINLQPKNYFSLIYIVVLTMIIIPVFTMDINAQDEWNILYVNSYHEGYKWSDDIKSSIIGDLSTFNIDYKLHIEYLDTLQIDNENIKQYFEYHKINFNLKYASRNIDIIITSDDAAFNFINEYCSDIFKDVPIIFCGLNNFSDEKIANVSNPITGVTESLDIGNTLKNILNIHPKTKRIHYIVDNTITGQNINNNIMSQIKNIESEIEFIKVDKKNMSQIEDYVANLVEDDIVLYAIYYYDNEGEYFDYKEGIRRISKNSSVPIYGLWNFHLGYGILGGQLLDGTSQGSMAVNKAVSYMKGTPISDIPIENGTLYQMKFDYNQMMKFGIPIDVLPNNADIINYSKANQFNLLIIHSYEEGLKWTDNINSGIHDVLNNSDKKINTYIEHLDLKCFSDSNYLRLCSEILKEKYKTKPIDLIITSDNGALDFVMNYSILNDENIPIVFCGLNYYDDEVKANYDNITGVVEVYDLKSTIDLIISLQKDAEKIVFINDMTATGQANRKIADEVISSYEGKLEFEFLEDINMLDVQKKVSKLDKDTAIILLSFNKDKSNNVYSYNESIELIKEYASVPIYSVWDFMLGKGVVGGKMINGYDQGTKAGELALRILNGEKPEDIPVFTENLDNYMIDMRVMKEFNLNTKKIPKDSILINENKIIDLYKNNKLMFNLIIIIFICAVIIIILLSYLLKNSHKSKIKIEKLATTDNLTGIYNRGAGICKLTQILEENNNKQKTTVVAFIDINNLKKTNDMYGHKEGDFLIRKCVDVLLEHIDSNQICARLGGDEFLIVFSDIIEKEAERIMQSYKNELKTLSEIYNKPYEFSVSIGFAKSSKENVYDVQTLIEKADLEMYKDKKRYKSIKDSKIACNIQATKK